MPGNFQIIPVNKTKRNLIFFYLLHTSRNLAMVHLWLCLLSSLQVPEMEKNSCPIPMEVALLQHIPNHTNVIHLYDYVERDNYLVMVLERPEPTYNLRDFRLIDPGAFRQPAMIKFLFKQILNGVMHCLKAGVFHGDLKVDNVLVDLTTKRAIIIDFDCGGFIDISSGSYCEIGRGNLGIIIMNSPPPPPNSHFPFSRILPVYLISPCWCACKIVNWECMCVCVHVHLGRGACERLCVPWWFCLYGLLTPEAIWEAHFR